MHYLVKLALENHSNRQRAYLWYYFDSAQWHWFVISKRYEKQKALYRRCWRSSNRIKPKHESMPSFSCSYFVSNCEVWFWDRGLSSAQAASHLKETRMRPKVGNVTSLKRLSSTEARNYLFKCHTNFRVN